MDKKIEKPCSRAVALGPMTFGEMMFHQSIKKKYEGKAALYPFRGASTNISRTAPQERIENGESVLLVWREYHELDFETMAGYMNVPVLDYMDMESGYRPTPFIALKNLCRNLRLHPIELYDPHDIVDPEYMALLLDAYQNPASYHMEYGDLHEDLVNALFEQADDNESYYGLTDYYEEIASGQSVKHQHKAAVLRTLFINDGNPFFATMMSPSEYIDAVTGDLHQQLERTEKTVDTLQRFVNFEGEEIRNAASYMFGDQSDALIEKWFSYYEDMIDERDFHYCFMSDVDTYLHHNALEDDVDDFFNRLKSNFEKRLMLMDSVLAGYALTEKIEAMETMERDLRQVFAAYDIRQMVLQAVPSMKRHGQQNHDFYIQPFEQKMPVTRAKHPRSLSI